MKARPGPAVAPRPLGEITRHRLFKERMAYMAGDALRALLLEMRGYRTDVLDFAPSRFTDKNVMLRARKSAVKYRGGLQEEYEHLRDCLGLAPPLEEYLGLAPQSNSSAQPNSPKLARARSMFRRQ